MTARTFATALVLAALSGQAAGQNALGNGTEMGTRASTLERAKYGLGDGRGLDLNTQIGGNGRNSPVRDFQAEMRFRNSIVTGNAPNGMSFRGDLPYYAPNDFRGQTGSNDLYSFRRDSLYSGLAGMGIRGTEALQQQFALTAGNALPETLTGSLTVNRFGGGDPDFGRKVKNSLSPMGLSPNQDPGMLQRADPADLTPDLTGLQIGNNTELGTLRSTSAYTSTRGIQPTLLDIRQTPNQDLIGVTASGLRGIQSKGLGKATPTNSAAGAKSALAAGSALNSPGRAGAGAPGPLSTATPKTEAAIGSNAYTELMDRLTNYAGSTEAGGTDVRPEWQRQLDALRDELRASDLGVPSGAPGDQDLTGLGAGVPIAEPGTLPMLTPGTFGPVPPVKNYTFDAATLDTLRNASGQITSLLPLEDALDDAYASHMQIAQADLSRGHYFDAEEVFTRAIAVRPNDAMALVGRIHSQLGAGTYLSAWMNLRELFKNHPEMLATRYSAELLPAPERMVLIAETLRGLIARQGSLHRESAMLLAYTGYQMGDTEVLAEGLAAMDSAREGQADALTDLVAAVWSGKQAAPEPVAPAEELPGTPPPLMAEPQK
jgi:hypothetical protein